MFNVHNLENVGIYLVAHRLYADNAHRIGMLHVVLDALGSTKVHFYIQIGECNVLCLKCFL